MSLAVYLGSAVALILAPGPDTAFVLARAVDAGRRTGVRAALGVATGVLVHTVAAVAGLAALLAAAPGAYDAVRLLGAGYLVFLGVSTVRRGGDGAGGVASGGFRQGLLTNVANPKVALFFLAFLPQFGRGLELLPLGGLYALLTAVYLGGLAAAAGRARAVVDRPGVERGLRYASGAVMVGLAALLLS